MCIYISWVLYGSKLVFIMWTENSLSSVIAIHPINNIMKDSGNLHAGIHNLISWTWYSINSEPFHKPKYYMLNVCITLNLGWPCIYMWLWLLKITFSIYMDTCCMLLLHAVWWLFSLYFLPYILCSVVNWIRNVKF